MNKIYIVVEEYSYEHSDEYKIILLTEDKETALSWAKGRELLDGNALSVKCIVYERNLNVPSCFNSEGIIFERSSEEK